MVKIYLVLCFALLMTVAVWKVWADEEVTPDAGLPAVDEKTEFSFGTVKKNESGKITLSSFVPETSQVVERVYSENAQTQVQGGKTLQDLKPGDFVEIDYVVRGDKNILKYVTLGAGELPGGMKKNPSASELRMDETEMQDMPAAENEFSDEVIENMAENLEGKKSVQ